MTYVLLWVGMLKTYLKLDGKQGVLQEGLSIAKMTSTVAIACLILMQLTGNRSFVQASSAEFFRESARLDR